MCHAPTPMQPSFDFLGAYPNLLRNDKLRAIQMAELVLLAFRVSNRFQLKRLATMQVSKMWIHYLPASIYLLTQLYQVYVLQAKSKTMYTLYVYVYVYRCHRKQTFRSRSKHH